MNKKMYINIVHRTEVNLSQLEALKFQQAECQKNGLKTTLLIGYPSMLQPEIVDYVKAQGEREDVELGISFHDITCSPLSELAGSNERALYLLYQENKTRVVKAVFEKFKELFGFIPHAVADYILDSFTLNYIKAEYPGVEAAITNCFEEGVKMFQGNNHWWYLFNDGGPWGAYYPSRDGQLIPARDSEDDIGIVGLPHLNRDMVLCLTSRDDYFASHPLNVMRAKANDGYRSPYMFHFVDQWLKQAEYNGFVYYNVFVSLQWICEGSMFIDDIAEARRMYAQSLAYYKKLINDGVMESVFMEEFALWYRENVPVGTPEVNLWDDILCGSKRQTFWYVDPYFRMAIDMNLGGMIVDLRPYVGHLDRSMGPDSKNLWNGNYPFIMSWEHRPGSEQFCLVEYNGHRADIKEQRVKGKHQRTEDNKHQLVVDPMELEVGDLTVTLQSVFTFMENGSVEIERRILKLSDPLAKVRVVEYHSGCQGTSEYPEDITGTKLSISDGTETKEMDYVWKSRSISMNQPVSLKAQIPQVDTLVEMKPVSGSDEGSIKEGHLFFPFYVMEIAREIGEKEALITCLTITKP